MSIDKFFAATQPDAGQYLSAAGQWEKVLSSDPRRILVGQFDGGYSLWPSAGGQPKFTPTSPVGQFNRTFTFPIHGPLTCFEWWQFGYGIVGAETNWFALYLITDICNVGTDTREVPGGLSEIDWSHDLTKPTSAQSQPFVPPPDITRTAVGSGFDYAANLAATGGIAPKLKMQTPSPTLANALVQQQQQALQQANLQRAQQALLDYQQRSNVASQAAAEAAYYASFGQKPPSNPTLGY